MPYGKEDYLFEIKDNYVRLTDIAKKFNQFPDETLRGWIRNRNTIEYLATWEKLFNPNFKPGQMDGFIKKSGLNGYRPTIRQFLDETGAIGITSKPVCQQSH